MIKINPTFSRYFSNKIQKEKLFLGTKEKLFLLIPNYCLWFDDTNNIKLEIKEYNKDILSIEYFWLFFTTFLKETTKKTSICKKYKALQCDFEEAFKEIALYEVELKTLILKINIYD